LTPRIIGTNWSVILRPVSINTQRGNINKYSTWKQANANDLNEWLKVKNMRAVD